MQWKPAEESVEIRIEELMSRTYQMKTATTVCGKCRAGNIRADAWQGACTELAAETGLGLLVDEVGSSRCDDHYAGSCLGSIPTRDRTALRRSRFPKTLRGKAKITSPRIAQITRIGRGPPKLALSESNAGASRRDVV